MSKFLKMLFALMCVGGLSFTVVGCDDGSAENAGESIDRAADDLGDAVDDAADEVDDAFDID